MRAVGVVEKRRQRLEASAATLVDDGRAPLEHRGEGIDALVARACPVGRRASARAIRPGAEVAEQAISSRALAGRRASTSARFQPPGTPSGEISTGVTKRASPGPGKAVCRRRQLEEVH
jgi:hypothetical protein